MKFYHKTKLSYIEMKASGGEQKLPCYKQGRSGTSCPRDQAPDNSILWPIAFVSKSLSSAEKRYNNIEALGITHTLKI